MEVKETFPPHFEEIQLLFPISKENPAIFCYGDTIHNPYGKEITPDLECHESVHSKQQGDDPDGWWRKYLTDPQFRLEQELEAYGEQYAFAKRHIEAAANEAAKEGKRLTAGKNNLIRHALESMSFALSGPTYGNIIPYGKAESKIRHYAKTA